MQYNLSLSSTKDFHYFIRVQATLHQIFIYNEQIYSYYVTRKRKQNIMRLLDVHDLGKKKTYHAHFSQHAH